MIDPTSFRKLSLEEKQNFTNQVLNLIIPVLGELPEYKVLVALVKSDFDFMKKTLEGLSHPEYTQAVVDGDSLRDGGISGIKGNATRSLNRKDATWVAAGTIILQAFDDFGDNMANQSMATETAEVDNLLAEIDRNPELKAAITTIQSDAWLQDVRDGQHQVKSSIEKRGASNASKTLPSTIEASRPLIVSINKLFRFINMKLEFEPKPELLALSFRLNDVIGGYKSGLKLRETLHKQKKQDKKKAQESLDND
jgi:hypothetical protein